LAQCPGGRKPASQKTKYGAGDDKNAADGEVRQSIVPLGGTGDGFCEAGDAASDRSSGGHFKEKKEELGAGSQWDPEWDQIVETSLPAEMLSAGVARDVRPFCPRFATMSEGDKRAFWAYFFQALAGAEAGLKPTADVRHTEPEVAKRDTVTQRMVRSEGLLQLTYMDSKRYACDFDWEADKALPEKDPAKTILQPRNNLTCGVKILENQLITLRRPLLTQTSYWSTLQPGRPSYRVFAKQMANVPIACRKIPVKTAAR
jgi:hypothetical protein